MTTYNDTLEDLAIGARYSYPLDVKWESLILSSVEEISMGGYYAFRSLIQYRGNFEVQNKILFIVDISTDIEKAWGVYQHDDRFYLVTLEENND